MKGKRLLALALSAAMATGSSLMAFAGDMEGKEEATGQLQYVETGDIFSVVLPTDAGTTFDYLLDPDGLIQKTSGARYGGKVFDDGKTVYFLHTNKVDGTVNGTAGTGNCDYSDTSDEITVTNKSTGAVNITVTAKIAETEGVKMAATSSMSGDGENLYMAIVGKNDTAADETKALTTEGVTLTGSIAEDPDAYEIKWDTSAGADKGKYVKALRDENSTPNLTTKPFAFKSYTFKLTGACKANDTALLALKENPPKIDLTWSVKDFTVTGPQITFGSDGVITISGLTAEKNYKASTLECAGTTYPLDTDRNVTWGMDDWDRENGGTFVITLKDSWLTFIGEKSAKVTVTLADGTTIDANKQ